MRRLRKAGVLNLSSGAVLVFIQENAGKRIVYYSVEAAKKWISTKTLTAPLQVVAKYSLWGGIIIDAGKSLIDPTFLPKAAFNTTIYYGAYIIKGATGFWIGGTYMVLDQIGVIDAMDSDIKMPEVKPTYTIQSDNATRFNPYKK